MKRAVCLSALVLGLLVAWSSPAEAVHPVVQCQAAKLKAWAKRRACEHKMAAKAAMGGTADVALCMDRFGSAMTRAGIKCRFVDATGEDGDGTVIDLDTGLMWQKTDDDGGLTDKDNAYTWSASGTAPDGTVFAVFLAGLNDAYDLSAWPPVVGGCFAGHCDWRLPQFDELAGIVDCSLGNPCIEWSEFGPVNRSSVYWSSTGDSEAESQAWEVHFDDSNMLCVGKSAALYARAVREGL
jgi:hypothetical protein